MSEHHRDPDADWALASAYVDGDVDANERATVEGDPHLLDLVARLGGVRTALAAPFLVAETVRTAAIAAALDRAQSDIQTRLVAGDAGDATVLSLSAHGRRTRRWLGRAAAAAVVAVLVGVAVTDRSSDEGSGATSKASATTIAAGFGQSEAATAAGAAGSAEAAAPVAPTATVGTAITTGGAATAPRQDTTGAPPVAIDDPEQLLDLPVAERTTAGASSTTTASASTSAGTSPGASTPSCVDPDETLLAVITYRGTTTIATLDAPAHVRRAKATADCTILAEVPDPS
ncbi:MAG: hypothetical protein QM733_04815 [Ilumatobacteraceae bacterium]